MRPFSQVAQDSQSGAQIVYGNPLATAEPRKLAPFYAERSTSGWYVVRERATGATVYYSPGTRAEARRVARKWSEQEAIG